MSRLITLECDANEVRVAVGASGLTGVSIEKILSAPIELQESEEAWGSSVLIRALRTLLIEAGVRSGETIVCVSRNDIELRAITLPDVDANELPDMVRFAAPRYFANVTDQWPLDFITMPSHLEGSVDCVVGAINPALIQKIERTLTEVGLNLSHMVLRPMAAVAGAMARNPDWIQGSVLFMDLLNDEADVVISERGNAVFMRAFHAPADMADPQSAKMLSGEIKRTLLAAASQRSGLEVDRIVLWTKDSLAPVAEELSKTLDLPVTMLDPFSWAEKAEIAVAATTQTVGRFAPILGAFHFMQQRNRLIDFTNPRKRVEKKKPIATYALAASAAVLVLGGAWWWYSSSHSQLDSEIALLEESISSQATALKAAGKHAADWTKIETFLKGDVRWLDELAALSARAQDPDKAYFGTTTFMLEPRSNIASISAKYYATGQEVVPEVQAAYRDTQHIVRGTSVTQSPDKNYPWASDLTITLAPVQVTDPRNVKRTVPPEKTAADTPPADTPPADTPAADTPAADVPTADAPAADVPGAENPDTNSLVPSENPSTLVPSSGAPSAEKEIAPGPETPPVDEIPTAPSQPSVSPPPGDSVGAPS